MKESIENIWKEGFIKNDALVAPKINDLYNQRSLHLIDKMMRMFRINLLAILGFALGVLVISFLAGFPYLGTFISMICISLVVIGRRNLDKLETIDKGSSSYEYLKKFKLWRKEVESIFGKVYMFFYPAFAISMLTLVWKVTMTEQLMGKMLQEYPDMDMTFGMPTIYLTGVLILAGLLSIFSQKLYKWDIDIVYGNVFKRLDEMLQDMEELRK